MSAVDAILAEGLTRRFGAKTALDHLDLRVAQGEVFGFLGPNGAGKTTTVRLLNGILAATEGTAKILGVDVVKDSAKVRELTGVLTETPSLYEGLSAKENLRFYGELYGVPEAQLDTRVHDTLDEFGLLDRADDKVGIYSKGMKQRLAIARAFLHQPSLIFLDEPTASLDPGVSRMVWEAIQKQAHQQGRTIFLCTHNLAEAERLCDRVGVIDHGVLQAVGTPRELARQLWHNLWIEMDLHGENSPQALAVLDRLPCVHQHVAENSVLLLELDNEDSIPDVITALVAVGVRIYGISPRQHTLEEIYFEIEGNGKSNGSEEVK